MIEKNNHIGREEVFLATTALEDFWDTSKPIVYLGEWCRRYSRKSFWEPLHGKLVCSPWSDRKKLIDAFHYVNRIYECYLPIFAESLNNLHRERLSLRYWRIVIGPWLQMYIAALFDRYSFLRAALDQFPGCTTIGLSEVSFITPCYTIEFVQFIKEDSYNLQLYTRLLLKMGKDFLQKKNEVVAKPFVSPQRGFSLRTPLRRYFDRVLQIAEKSKTTAPCILLRNSYFSVSARIHLFLKTGGKVAELTRKTATIPSFYLDHHSRESLSAGLSYENEFEKILKEMIPLDIPQTFIEGYEAVKNEVVENYPVAPKAIFSANGWYYDEVFKQWAGYSAEKGTILLGTQHGGNYGCIAFMPSEIHELKTADVYYTWGWKRSDYLSKTIPLPVSKLIGRKMMGPSNKKKGILFVATSTPRYALQFPFCPHDFDYYLDWQFRFVTSLFPEIRSTMRVRLHYEDLGWDIKERWNDFAPDVSIEGWKMKFMKSLENCHLFICDHLSTTFVEALAVNKPSILFWNPVTNELRPDAQPYFDQLRAGGILYDSPEAAAKALNFIYDDVEQWWNEPGRQAIRRSFCDQFARTSPNAIKEWTAEFNRISERVIANEPRVIFKNC